VAALEERQRHFKNPGFARLELEFLSTLRRGADLSELFLVLPTFGLLSNHNPGSAFRASDARARNVISHSKIILRLEQSTVDGTGIRRKPPTFPRLGEFCGRMHFGWWTVRGFSAFARRVLKDFRIKGCR
jgi:hypothetical protein